MERPQLYLRVNGIDIEAVKIRRKIDRGLPTGEREVVIEDPRLGCFSIDDSFVIEVRSSKRKKWETTSVLSLLQSMDIMREEKYQ